MLLETSCIYTVSSVQSLVAYQSYRNLGLHCQYQTKDFYLFLKERALAPVYSSKGRLQM